MSSTDNANYDSAICHHINHPPFNTTTSSGIHGVIGMKLMSLVRRPMA